MKFPDRPPCDLKCMEQAAPPGTVHEFKGPVKIILVDPPEDQYHRRKTGATFVAFANMMIGANFIIVLLFTLGFKLPFYTNLHIILSTVGYQFCMPSAILMLNSLNGASAPLKKTQRRKEHIIIHFIGLLCGIFGAFVGYWFEEESDPNTFWGIPFSPHCMTGLAAAALSVLCVLTGPIIFIRKSELTNSGFLISIHRTLGILTFLVATACFIFGIVKPSFQIWLYIIGYMSPAYVMLFFTLFYTSVVLTAPVTNFISSSCCKKKPNVKLQNADR